MIDSTIDKFPLFQGCTSDRDYCKSIKLSLRFAHLGSLCSVYVDSSVICLHKFQEGMGYHSTKCSPEGRSIPQDMGRQCRSLLPGGSRNLKPANKDAF